MLKPGTRRSWPRRPCPVEEKSRSTEENVSAASLSNCLRRIRIFTSVFRWLARHSEVEVQYVLAGAEPFVQRDRRFITVVGLDIDDPRAASDRYLT